MDDKLPGSTLLKPAEWAYLAGEMRMTDSESLDRSCSIPSRDLLNKQRCVEYLEQLGVMYESPSIRVTASTFSKRYAFLIVSPALYAMTMYNKGFDLTIDNCYVESAYRSGDRWQPNLRLRHMGMTEPDGGGKLGEWSEMQSDAGKRDEWREGIVRSIFAGHLAVVWRSISKAARIPMATLWENTAIFVYALYEKRITEAASAEEKLRKQADFEYLIHRAPAFLFGEKQNPLAAYYGPKCESPGSPEPIRKRKTCCLYYKLSDGGEDYCPTCPLLANKARLNTSAL